MTTPREYADAWLAEHPAIRRNRCFHGGKGTPQTRKLEVLEREIIVRCINDMVGTYRRRAQEAAKARGETSITWGDMLVQGPVDMRMDPWEMAMLLEVREVLDTRRDES